MSSFSDVDAIGNVIVPPFEVLKAWQTPEYPHGERRDWMPAFAVPLLVLSSTLVVLRIVLRTKQRGGGCGLDDAFLGPSWMLLVGFTGCVVWSSKNGTLDRHMWDLEPAQYQTVALSAWVGQFIFLIGTCFMRISVLLFYRRIVKGTFKRRWMWTVWAAIAFTVAWTVALCIMLLVTCQPMKAAWKVFDPTFTQDWTCVDTRSSSYVAGILAVISDFYALCLPWVMTFSLLEMPRRRKIALNAVFSLGLVVVAAAVMRTRDSVKLGKDYDSTWVGFWVYFWTILEWNLAVICACAPCLRVVFRVYLRESIESAFGHINSRDTSFHSKDQERVLSPAQDFEMKRTLTIESEEPHAHHDNDYTHGSATPNDGVVSFRSSHVENVFM